MFYLFILLLISYYYYFSVVWNKRLFFFRLKFDVMEKNNKLYLHTCRVCIYHWIKQNCAYAVHCTCTHTQTFALFYFSSLCIYEESCCLTHSIYNRVFILKKWMRCTKVPTCHCWWRRIVFSGNCCWVWIWYLKLL